MSLNIEGIHLRLKVKYYCYASNRLFKTIQYFNISSNLSEVGKGENDRASVILHNITYKGRGYKDVY
jgi:hypothetical protein